MDEHMKRALFASQAVLFFRVSPYHKAIYMSLPAERKKLVKEGLVRLIEALRKPVGQPVERPLQMTINVNLNVPADLLKSSSKKDCEEDRFLKEKVKMLEEKLRDAEELIDYYKQKFREVKAEVLNLEAMVKRRGNLELVIYLERIKKHLC